MINVTTQEHQSTFRGIRLSCVAKSLNAQTVPHWNCFDCPADPNHR